jgi:hypothetical protein
VASLTLGQREINCFTFLHTNKVATSKQIHRAIFGKDYSNFCKKMRKYEELKLVNRLTGAKEFDLSGVYELTKKGFNVVRANRKGMIAHNRYKSNSIFHDLFLVEIRHILKSRELVMSYHTENQIQTTADFDTEKSLVDFKRLHCDALMVIKHAKSGRQIKVALEFELSDKSMKDYRKKLSDYYSSNGIAAVLYICKDKQTEIRIKKSELDVYQGNISRVHYLQYEMLQNIDQVVTFYAQNGALITV